MSCFDVAYRIIQQLKSHGFTAYFAGGWVRDFLMNHPSDDIDIATDATTQDISRIFEKTIPVGIQFGIIIVVLEDHHFEVATFRKDHGYEDGRRPIGVEQASPEEDARRRDFTINGMFYDPLEEKILDYVGGQQDLEKKLVKAIGNPHQRFIEDRLRMIRAIRYSCRFQFNLDDNTKNAIITHANSLFPSVAIERVWQEFSKMAQFGDFRKFLISLHEVELLQTIFPDLKQIDAQTLVNRLNSFDFFPNNTPLIAKVLQLFPSFHIEQALNLCNKLKLSNQTKDFVRYYYKVKQAFEKIDPFKNCMENYDWAHLYAHKDFSLCLSLTLADRESPDRESLLSIHQKKQTDLKEAIERIQNKIPAVSSADLKKEGIKPGVRMGALLKEAERISINEKIYDSESIILKLKKGPLWPKNL